MSAITASSNARSSRRSGASVAGGSGAGIRSGPAQGRAQGGLGGQNLIQRGTGGIHAADAFGGTGPGGAVARLCAMAEPDQLAGEIGHLRVDLTGGLGIVPGKV